MRIVYPECRLDIFVASIFYHMFFKAAVRASFGHVFSYLFMFSASRTKPGKHVGKHR